MHHDQERYRRRSIRLPDYDYTQPGAYFLTIVAHDRRCLFGEIAEHQVRLSPFGQIVIDEWLRTATIRSVVRLTPEECVVMPNHVHGILWITHDDAGARHRRAPTEHRDRQAEQFGRPLAGSVPTIVRAFKAAVTTHINARRGTPGAPVWQRNYHEHVIRTEADLERARRYIVENPARWTEDAENPARATSA